MKLDTAPRAEPLRHFMPAELRAFGQAAACVRRMAGTPDRRRDPHAAA
ncbi:hypothetical protein [Roseicella aerolata]|uniref:Uncharacterized protein n=1 Tax=Roseicella aerolata TaxID=2883479 RepID=A0A9X1IFJ1_9PROT|nr:hypothetical protein [Roseicella aerolata]MCB4823881.1 hypothetical protein [Roseicella aerolata]